MRFVSDDVELEYEVRGEGPELVWLHGLSGSLEESRPLCEALATGYRVLWYSTRGHGRSTAPLGRRRYSYDVIADDLQRVLDHVGFERPLVGGGSHGANTALRHALRHPGNARGLLLVAPGANALRRPDRLRWALVRGQMTLAARRGEPHVVKAITGVDPRLAGLDEVSQQAVDAARTHAMPALLDAMRWIPNQQVVPPAALSTIDLPATVAAWDKDPVLHPIAVARRIAALLPKAQFVQVPKPGEMGPARSHALVNGLVADLLARC
ncbi:MAG TPA: alpha/beta hydrolase [Mycobacteriales bacterium]|nr:alpha/beta hydrolase [Mycobacteriales bacterium]